MKKKLFLAAAALAVLASCSGPTGQSTGAQPSSETLASAATGDEQIREIYQLYVKNAESNGETPKDYETWLASIKGQKGDPGKDGYSLLTGHGAPSESLGKTGDSYIDLDSWDFYVKATSGWAREGNLRESGERYTVKWLDYDGAVLETDVDVEKGSIPSYGGVTPTRERDGKHVYTFTGWSPELTAVTSDQAYVAQYEADAQTYTITWKDYDGTVLEVDEGVDFGAVPTFDQTFPTRAEEESCTYEFSGWTPSVGKAVANQTYVATYRKSAKQFLVKFVDDDGTLLQSSMMEYGSTPAYNNYSNPSKAQDDQYTYAFKGWDKDLTPVTKAETYTAVYDRAVRQYTISWYVQSYGTIKSEKLDYGTVPVAPEESDIPAKSPTISLEYEFAGWDKPIAKVTGDTTYNAVYASKARQYTVTWCDASGNQLKQEKAEYNASIDSYTPAVTDNQVFKGWTTSQGSTYAQTFPYNCRGDVTFYAIVQDKFTFTYLPLTDSYAVSASAGTSDLTTFPSTFNDGVHGTKSVTEISQDAFKSTSITSMIIPSTVKKIAGGAFASCKSLTTLFIPKSVTAVQEGIILGDTTLSIYCEATSKPSGWDSYWNVVKYFVSSQHSSSDTFNTNITWNYQR